MLREVRDAMGLTLREISDMLGVHYETTRGRENRGNPDHIVLTEYIDNLDMPEVYDFELRQMRKTFWEYDESMSPISNELRRIRIGLGRTGAHLSRLMGYTRAYWTVQERRGTPVSLEDLGELQKHFNLSATTIRRYRIIVERTDLGKPIPEVYKTDNPEIQEPEDLYDGQTEVIDREAYMELLMEIEDENGGSILNASEEDPKMMRLRELMGVIYYDDRSGI